MNDPKRILIVLLALITLSVCAFGIKGHMDSDGYKNQVNYTTAIQSTTKDDFNYIVDSQQGRVLANGTFTTKGEKQAKFDEMNKGYTYVNRVKEHYTMHTRTVCSGSGKSESCHTEVYYTWDEVSSDDSYADKISFMGRNYPPTLFDYSQYASDTDCDKFSPAVTGTGWLETKHGCIDGNFYLDDDNRYVYNTVPTTFNATFLATTYGGLKPFQENAITLQNKSIAKVLHDVGRYQLIGFWFVLILIILLTISGIIVAYNWVMADGMWSLTR